MKNSTDRFLTTHVGSLPRSAAVTRCVFARERVIAGTDCGFATFAGFGKVDAEIVYAKLAALGLGAQLASERLWRRSVT